MTQDITQQQAELAKEISLDLLQFISYHRHSLKGLSREGVVDKYIKTYTKGVTAWESKARDKITSIWITAQTKKARHVVWSVTGC